MPSGLIIGEGEKTLYIAPSGREWATLQMVNVGDRMNPGIRILPLPNVKSLLGVRMSGERSG